VQFGTKSWFGLAKVVCMYDDNEMVGMVSNHENDQKEWYGI
jgi:hypothetical protein